MGITTTPPLEPALPSFPVARFTTEQYLEMIRAEILTKEDRVELIDGVITPMAPAGNEHTWEVINLNEAFQSAWETHYLVVQGTTPIGPQDVYDPDFFLVRRGNSEQKKSYPKTEDIDLVVEVAKSSLRKDRTKKAAAYAAAAIPDYWIVDINSRQVIVHRNPQPDGYQSIENHGLEAVVNPLGLPGLQIRVGDIFDS